MLAPSGSGLGLRDNSEVHSPGLFQMLILSLPTPPAPATTYTQMLLLLEIFEAS